MPFRRFGFVTLVALAAACGGSATGTDTPPTEPTHHARVEGRVTDLNGQPLGSVNVAVVPAASNPLSVMGSTVTNTAGHYEFEIRTFGRVDGNLAVDMYIRAAKYAVSGGRATIDSIRVAVQLVPRDAPPPTVLVEDVRLRQ